MPTHDTVGIGEESPLMGDDGLGPGSLVILESEEIPRFLSTKVSPHQIDLREVIALAEFRGSLPERLVVLGLQPERVEMSAELGPAVSAALATWWRRQSDFWRGGDKRLAPQTPLRPT